MGVITVEGRVVDSLEGAIPYAVVRVPEIRKGTYADERGYFKLILPDGRWRIVVSAVGRTPDTVVISGRDTLVSLKVVLRPSPIRAKEIVITAKREEFRKGTVEPFKFEAEVIRDRPSFLTSDVLKAIQDVPGVVMAADFSSKFSVRGGGPQENIVLFDDVPVFNPYHMAGLFSVFISDALSGFTFYRSNFPARYGGVLSSILDVQVAEPDSTHGSASISFLASQVFQTFKRGNFGGLVALRRSYFDITAKWFGYDLPYHFYDGIAKVYWDVKPSWRLSLAVLQGDDVLDLYFRTAHLYASWGNTVLSLRSRAVIGERWVNLTTFGLTLFRDRISFGFKDQTIVSITAPMNLGTFRSQMSSITDEREIRAGFSVEPGWGGVEQDFFGMKYEDKGNTVVSAVYGEYLLKRGVYNLSIGGRLNAFYAWFPGDMSRYNVLYVNPEPRITFRYFLSPDVAIKGGWGVFHQYHVGLSMGGGQLGEVLSSFYYWTSVFRGWEPMRAFHYSLGITGITAWGDWEVEAFYKDYPYVLLENPTPDINDIYGTLFRKGKAWAYGFDGYVRKDAGKLRLLLSYSFLIARMKVGDTLHPSPWDRRHAVVFTLNHPLPWSTVGGLRFTYQSGMPYTGVIARYDVYSMYDPGIGKPIRIGTREIYSIPYTLRYPPYHRMDVYVRKDFRIRRFNGYVSLSIVNVYNRKNVWFYMYDYTKDPPVKTAFYQLPVFPSLEFGLRW